MKLTRIYLNNFLSYHNITDIDSIENKIIFVGPNGSGKSNIIRFIQLIKEFKANMTLNWHVFPYWERDKECYNYIRVIPTNKEKEFLDQCLLYQLCSLNEGDPTKIEQLITTMSEYFSNDNFMSYIEFYVLTTPNDIENLSLWIFFPLSTNKIMFFSNVNSYNFYIYTNDQNKAINILELVTESSKYPSVEFQNQNTLLRDMNTISPAKYTTGTLLPELIKDLWEKHNKVQLRVQYQFSINRLSEIISIREKIIEFKDKLYAIDKNLIYQNALNVASMFLKELNKKIIILPEHRGLLQTSQEDILTLNSIINILFAKKNSFDPDEHVSFQKIQNSFSELLDIKFDVALEERNTLEFIKKPVGLVLYPDNQHFSLEGSKILDRYQEQGFIPIQYPKIVFYKGGESFDLNHAPGGAYELLMILTTLEIAEADTILLDEPGKTLHPTLIQRLHNYLTLVNEKKTLLIVTHSPYLIHHKELNKIVHCNYNKELGSKIRFFEKFLFNQRTKRPQYERFCENTFIKSVFFATKVLFVEGVEELILFSAIFSKLEEQQFTYQSKYRFDAEIIVMFGKGDSAKAKELCEFLKTDFILVLDYDAWTIKDKTGKIVESNKSIIGKNLFSQELENTDISTWEEEDIHLFERKRNVFTWPKVNKDLEGAVATVRKEFDKENWKEMTYEEISILAEDLLNSSNSNPIRDDLFEFLKQKGYLIPI